MKPRGMRLVATLLAFVVVATACRAGSSDRWQPEAPTTAAATLRTALDVLLREHVYLLGIAIEKALTAQKPQFDAATVALEENTLAIADRFETLYGERAEKGFLAAWRPYTDAIGHYAGRTVSRIPIATFDRAFQSIVRGVASFAAGLTPLINAALIGTRIRDLVASVRTVVDAQLQRDYAKAGASLRGASDRAGEVAATFARAFADDMPAQYPGDASSPAASLRATLAASLTDHVYLVGMTAENVVTAQPRLRDGAKSALDTASAELAGHIGASYGAEAAEAFGAVWKRQADLFLAYAGSAGDEPKREAIRTDLEQYATDASTYLAGLNEDLSQPEMERLVGVHGHTMTQAIDAMVAKDFERAYLRLRAAVAQVEALGTAIVAATVSLFPRRFVPTPTDLPG